jgi:cell division protein FtsL
MPGFDAQLNEISTSDKSITDKLSEEIALRTALTLKLEKEKQALEKRVTKNPNDVQAIEEIRTLDATIASQNKDIADQQQELAELSSGTPSIGSPIAAVEKQNEIQKIAPTYESSIQNGQNKTRQEVDLAIANETELNERIVARMEEVLNSLNDSPQNKALKRESEVLTALFDENNQRLSSLQNEKSGLERESITQADKDQIIDQLDPEYRKFQIGLNESIATLSSTELDNSIFAERKLLSQIYERIEELTDENGAEAQGEKAILEAIAEDLQTDISTRQDIVKSRNAAQFSEVEKAFAISALSPDYSTTASTVSASNLPKQEKDVLLMDNEKQLLRKLYSAIEEQEKRLADNPNNAEAIRQLALLEQLEAEASDRLKALDPDGIQSALAMEKMTDKLLSDYSSRKNFIVSDAKMNSRAKDKALLNLDQELLEVVEEEIFRLDALMGMGNATNEIATNIETLNSLRSALNRSIAEYKEIINLPSDDPELNEQKERILVDVMPDYSSRISEIQTKLQVRKPLKHMKNNKPSSRS